MFTISRKWLTLLRSCCKASSERTKTQVAWCMALQAFRSVPRSSWKSFSRSPGKREFTGDNMATTRIEIAPMKAAQIPRRGADFEIVEREIPQPGVGQVRIKVQACGVCHSDVLTKEGQWPGIQYPRVPGHEIAGVIDTVGAGIEGWQAGQRVGVGWHGGHCGRCEHCRQGDFVLCERALVPGISYDGGYAEFMLAPVE